MLGTERCTPGKYCSSQLPLALQDRTLPQNPASTPDLTLSVLSLSWKGEVPVLAAGEAALQHPSVPKQLLFFSCSDSHYQGNVHPCALVQAHATHL